MLLEKVINYYRSINESPLYSTGDIGSIAVSLTLRGGIIYFRSYGLFLARNLRRLSSEINKENFYFLSL